MRKIKVKAVILTAGDKYFIHGSDDETPAEMFKKMAPMWDFDPSQEMVNFIEIEVTLPELEKPTFQFEIEKIKIDPYAG